MSDENLHNINQPQTFLYYDGDGQENPFLFTYIWKAITKHKLVILIIAVISISIAFAVAMLMTPIYRAEALIVPISKESTARFNQVANQFGGLASLAGINIGSGDNSIDVTLAILKSRDFTTQFIKEKKLLHKLFNENWDSKNSKWKLPNKVPTILRANNKFNSIRKVEVDRKTGLIKLGIEWVNAVEAAEWVMELVHMINNKLRQEAIIESERSIEFLENELEKTSVIEVKQSIYNLIEAQTKNKMLANTQQDYAFRVLDKAIVPEEKIKPKRKLIVLSGGFLGIVLGVFVACIIPFFKK